MNGPVRFGATLVIRAVELDADEISRRLDLYPPPREPAEIRGLKRTHMVWEYPSDGHGESQDLRKPTLEAAVVPLLRELLPKAGILKELADEFECYFSFPVFYDCEEIASPTIAFETEVITLLSQIGLPAYASVYPCSDTSMEDQG